MGVDSEFLWVAVVGCLMAIVVMGLVVRSATLEVDGLRRQLRDARAMRGRTTGDVMPTVTGEHGRIDVDRRSAVPADAVPADGVPDVASPGAVIDLDRSPWGMDELRALADEPQPVDAAPVETVPVEPVAAPERIPARITADRSAELQAQLRAARGQAGAVSGGAPLARFSDDPIIRALGAGPMSGRQLQAESGLDLGDYLVRLNDLLDSRQIRIVDRGPDGSIYAYGG